MNVLSKLLSERVAKKVAAVIEAICYLVMLVYILGLALSIIGRQQVNIHTSTGTYNRAILAENEDGWQDYRRSRVFMVNTNDEIHISVNDGVDAVIRIAVSTTFAVRTIPLTISFCLLSRVFRNVSKGQIFISKNAAYLLYFGIIQITAAILTPFINLGIIDIADRLSVNSISIGTGSDMFNQIIPNIAAIVAAYIIHYGVHLQDEADHTL